MVFQLPELWVGEFSLAGAVVAAPENSVAEKIRFAHVVGVGSEGGKTELADQHGVWGAGVGVALVAVPAVVLVVVEQLPVAKLELLGIVACEIGWEEAIRAAAKNKGWFRSGGSWTWLV